MSELEGIESGVSTGAETQSAEQPSPVAAQTESSGQEASSSQPQKEAPFHEHPRFQEVIAQKNQLAQQVQQYAATLQQMQAKMQSFEKAQTQTKGPSYDALLQRLEGIDPEFAKLQKEQYQKLSSVEQIQQELNQLREWREHQEAENLRNQAESRLTGLYSKNNIPEEHRKLYRAHVENAVYREEAAGRPVSVSDLDRLFEETHRELSGFLSSYERKQRESYVAEKKKDASAPSTTGGAPVAHTPKPGNKSVDQIKAELAKMIRERGSVI